MMLSMLIVASVAIHEHYFRLHLAKVLIPVLLFFSFLCTIPLQGELTAPTFFLKELPPETQALQDTIRNADCYIIVSPEYNHSVPPALASLMGHFGGSCYAFKPSSIVTYSPGPWGGMRAAMAIQVMAHELGCLPGT